MFSKLKNSGIFKSFGIYALSGFIPKIISFLLILVFTNPAFMSTDDNGTLVLFNNAVMFTIPMVSLGVIQSAGAEYFKLDKKEFSHLFTAGFFLANCIALLCFVVLYFVIPLFSDKYKIPVSFSWLVPLGALFLFYMELWLVLARSQNKEWLFLKINAAKIIMELGIAVLLIVAFKYHWKGRIAGIIVSGTVIFSFALWYFIKNGYLKWPLRKKYIKQEILYALPLILFQFSVFSTFSSDNFFLTWKNPGNKGLVGVYGIACTFAAIVNMLGSAYMLYLMPKIYSLLSQPEPDYGAIKKQVKIFLLVNALMLLLVMVFTPVFYYLFIPEVYHSALKSFFFIVCGYALWNISYLFFSFLMYYKHKRIITILALCYICISLSLYFVFTKLWNQQGTAIAVLISYFLVMLVTLFFCRPYIKKMLAA